MNPVTKSLNRKYSEIQGLFYVVFCTVLGYAAVYLGAIGLSASIIGVILALGNVFSTLFSPVIARTIDRLHLSLSRVLMAIAGSVGVLAALMMLCTNMKAIVAVIFVILLGLLFAMLPLINSLAFVFEKHDIHISFGLGRGIGSAAYALTSLALGFLVRSYSPKLLPVLEIVIIAAFIPVIASFRVKGISMKGEESEHPSMDMKSFAARYKIFVGLIIGLTLVLADHTFINNFFINIVKNVGGDTSDMGIAVFLAAILELIAMNVFEKIKHRIEVGRLLKFSAVMFTVKHILTFLAPNMAVIYLAQCLQIFAYAIYIPAGVYYVDRLFDRADATLGQSLMASTATAGGVIASFVGGFLIDSIGVSSTLMIGMITSIIGTVIVLMTVQKTKKAGMSYE